MPQFATAEDVSAQQDDPSDVSYQIIHAQIEGLCSCGACAARIFAEADTPLTPTETAGGANDVPLPSAAEIIAGMQFQMSLLTDDTLHTAVQSPYVFTYQFESSEPTDLPTNESFTGWRAFTSPERAAIVDAMRHIETLANVEFVEVTGQSDPDLNLGMVDLPGSIAGYGGFRYSASSSDGGNTWFMSNYDNFAVFEKALDLTNYPSLILHELGHALTLKHSFSGDDVVPSAFENNKWTVMSYSVNPDTGQDGDVMQLFDILALQDRWGANMDTATGSHRYDGPRSATTDAIWDAGGATDWLDAKTYTTAVTLDLNQGAYSTFGSYQDVVIAFGTEIENARGGRGDDTLTGNDLDNTLLGAKGHDTLYGGGGGDSLQGHKGVDILYGEGGSDMLNGGRSNDQLFGGGGSDTLIGGRGGDWLEGGAGDDLLTGGVHKDSFVFREGCGADTVFDFEDDIDTLIFDMLSVDTQGQAATYAAQSGTDVVYDFGGGDVITIQNMTLAALDNDFDVA